MSTRPHPYGLWVLAVVLIGLGTLNASALVFHCCDGASNPSPTFPLGGNSLAILDPTSAIQAFQGSPDVSPGPDPVAIGVIALTLGAAIVALLIWRGGKVEEVFLVHWSGVLIVHLSRSIKAATDRDILAGMLTAIQQFVREAFVQWRGRDIRRIDFGDRKIVMTRGNHSYLAVVLRGHKPGWLSFRMDGAISEFEDVFEGRLEQWDGALETLSGAEEILSDALFEGAFVRLSRRLFRRVRPRDRDVPGPLAASARRRRRLMKVSSRAGLQRVALRLRQRRGLDEVDEAHRGLVETALEEISESRFSVCGFANIYLATVHLAILNQETWGERDPEWWPAVLQLIRDVLRLWAWDSEGQAWVSEREDSSPRLRFDANVAPVQRGLEELPKAPVLGPSVAARQSASAKEG